MACFDPADYLDEISTGRLRAELRYRSSREASGDTEQEPDLSLIELLQKAFEQRDEVTFHRLLAHLEPPEIVLRRGEQQRAAYNAALQQQHATAEGVH